MVVALPDDIQAFGVKRKYIWSMKTQLIKEVIAVPGDDVILTKDYIMVNGKKYEAPLHLYDLEHHSVAHIKRGNYFNTTEYWLYGCNDKKDSWDSRYFGPIKKSNIKGTAVPLIIF